ncbi:MAG: 2-hydroxy-3-oxopropionate reductase [Rhizobiales bacterium 17-65-6]|nr:MAG: 2-hydroxy-3-oxopropionate reductase [Rhizobiales bacterium 17-65-6]
MKAIGSLGFIGLGVMGEPMCANLVRKSPLPVTGTDLKREPIERLTAIGLKPADTIAGVARAADVIFLSLPSGAQVEEVCFGLGGIAAAKGRVHTVVDMSTSPVKLTRELAERMAAHGITFVDAPVARMRQAAKDGTLSIMVCGTPEVFGAVRPFLATMGTDITHCGGIGSGQVVKVLNNMVVFMTVNALAEALAIGRAAGVDGALLFDVMSKGSADSFALRTPGLKSLVPDTFPEQTFPTDYAIKDIKLALELASQGGIDAQAAKHTREMLEATSKAGYGRAYYPAMIRLIEATKV